MATKPKLVLVTGATSGIGYETVKAFLQSPKSYHVFLGSRTLKKGKEVLEKVRAECDTSTNTVDLLQIDLESDESIEQAFNSLKNGPGHVDILINNAGAAFDMTPEMSLRQCFNKAYDINVSGTHVLTHTFISLLLAAKAKSPESTPRIIFLAGLSQMTLAAESYFPTPPLPAGWPKRVPFVETIGYRCSKTALSMLMLDWNHKLQIDGVKVFSASPGTCVTGLGGVGEEVMAAMGGEHPREGARRVLAVAEGARDGDAGRIVDVDSGGFVPW